MEVDYSEAWKEIVKAEKEESDKNNILVDSIGREDFKALVSDCVVSGLIQIVDEPMGQNQDEPCGLFTEVWVDQWSTGDSGDSYAGNIYAKFAEGKWLKIPYWC